MLMVMPSTHVVANIALARVVAGELIK